jgi:hypothetical protein
MLDSDRILECCKNISRENGNIRRILNTEPLEAPTNHRESESNNRLRIMHLTTTLGSLEAYVSYIRKAILDEPGYYSRPPEIV